jgi:hypothetical protein
MFLDSDDIRGVLRGGAILAAAAAIALFASSFGSAGGMKKDKASGVVYFVEKQPPDPSRASLAWVSVGVSVSMLVASLVFQKRPIQPPQRNAGGRPSSGDSSASETPSSSGPRG